MLLAYKTFLDNGLKCKTIYKGQNIIMIEYEKYQIRILNLSNYISTNLNSLIDLFDLRLFPTYFPEKLNRKENYNLINIEKKIPLELFYQFNDTLEEKEKKNLFWNSAQNTCWNFQEQLLKHSLEQLEIVVHASIKFIIQCEDLQININKIFKRDPKAALITLPFARPFCTVSSFFYHLFKYHFLDPLNKIYSVPNEYPKKIQSSKEELEFAAYLQHQNPEKKIQQCI